MREQWKRLVTRVFRSSTEKPPETSAPDYLEVSKADAIAELCLPTGDDNLDHLHVILIDLVQKGFIQAVRVSEDNMLRYIATAAGKQYVEEQFQYSVNEFLQRTFGDDH